MPSKEYSAYKQDTARRYLRYVRSCRRRVEYMEDRVAYEMDRMDMLNGVSYEGECVKGSGPEHGDDAIARQVVRLNDLVATLKGFQGQYAGTVCEAENIFASLSCHEKAQQIMGLYWIERRKIRDIAEKTHYSPQRVKQVLNDGAEEVYGLMPHEWRDPNYPAFPNY